MTSTTLSSHSSIMTMQGQEFTSISLQATLHIPTLHEEKARRLILIAKKTVIRIECNSKNKSVLMNDAVRNSWKKELRKYVGIGSFVLVLTDEETASMPTMNRYKEVISIHTASNQAMSGVELTRIIELDEKNGADCQPHL